MSDESAADEMPPTARSGGRKSINKGRWSKEEVSKHTSAMMTVCALYCMLKLVSCSAVGDHDQRIAVICRLPGIRTGV
jgi:hypothetical protein